MKNQAQNADGEKAPFRVCLSMCVSNSFFNVLRSFPRSIHTLAAGKKKRSWGKKTKKLKKKKKEPRTRQHIIIFCYY